MYVYEGIYEDIIFIRTYLHKLPSFGTYEGIIPPKVTVLRRNSSVRTKVVYEGIFYLTRTFVLLHNKLRIMNTSLTLQISNILDSLA